MFVHPRDVQIQWGDCNPANIVYYPRAPMPPEIIERFKRG
jgi:hypothetical protein